MNKEKELKAIYAHKLLLLKETGRKFYFEALEDGLSHESAKPFLIFGEIT